MIKKLLPLLLFLSVQALRSQSNAAFADSLRKAYGIPELGYAIVSSTQVYELEVSGIKRSGSSLGAEKTDRFRIGSNTKAITGLIAALLVKEKKISWDTKFFDLFPELKPGANKAYHDLTLLNLLSFRTKLYSYTYTYAEPKQDQFKGNEAEQRYQFTKWFFKTKPVQGKDSVHFSNLGYIAAGLMLEKISGKSYKALVTDLGKRLDIHFGFGAPNSLDTLQPWGHDAHLIPEPPGDNFKLNWLLAAGNVHMSLPDYAKFIQLQLQGLAGKSDLLSAAEFNFLHYGLAVFSVGWFWDTDENNRLYSFSTGNPGTFLTQVFVYKNEDKAFILLSNSQAPATTACFDVLFKELYKKYFH